MYSVRYRRDIDLLDIIWTGLFTPDLVAGYTRELYDGFDAAGFQQGYLLRMDMRDSAVQTQEALVAFHRHLHDFPKARRIAIITDNPIARLQVRRVMQQPYLRIFATPDAGFDWLTEKAFAAVA